MNETIRPQASGYGDAGGSTVRRATKGFRAESGSPREDIDRINDTLRQRSRMLYMAAPIATSAIKTNRTKGVGVGLTLKSVIDRETLGLTQEQARVWQRKAEAEFALWANRRENCDALALNNFAALQQLTFLSWLMSGDCVVLVKRDATTQMRPYSLRLHVVEADRVSTPPEYRGGYLSGSMTSGKVPEGSPGAGNCVYDGVEVDEGGKVLAYHICDGFPDEFTAEEKTWNRVLAFGTRTGQPNVLHVMVAERPDQYRGVPYLAQVIEPLLQMRRYTESELWAALIQTFFTAWIETEGSAVETPFDEIGTGEGGPGDAPTGTVSDDDHEYEMGPGNVFRLRKGEKVVFGNPNVPSAGFEKFFDTMSRQLGAALEVPSDVLLKKFDASYSAARGALLEAWEAVRMRRSWFVDDFCQPVYELWLAEAVALGRIQAPGFFDNPLMRAAWCGAQWIGPVQSQLDPKKEAEAALLLAANGVKTYVQIARELGGGDWNDNIEQLAFENRKKAAASALAQEAETDKEEEEDAET